MHVVWCIDVVWEWVLRPPPHAMLQVEVVHIVYNVHIVHIWPPLRHATCDECRGLPGCSSPLADSCSPCTCYPSVARGESPSCLVLALHMLPQCHPWGVAQLRPFLRPNSVGAYTTVAWLQSVTHWPKEAFSASTYSVSYTVANWNKTFLLHAPRTF